MAFKVDVRRVEGDAMLLEEDSEEEDGDREEGEEAEELLSFLSRLCDEQAIFGSGMYHRTARCDRGILN